MKKIILFLAITCFVTMQAEEKSEHEIYRSSVAKIIDSAKEKYPNNYSMQASKIRWEIQELEYVMKIEKEFKNKK